MDNELSQWIKYFPNMTLKELSEAIECGYGSAWIYARDVAGV